MPRQCHVLHARPGLALPLLDLHGLPLLTQTWLIALLACPALSSLFSPPSCSSCARYSIVSGPASLYAVSRRLSCSPSPLFSRLIVNPIPALGTLRIEPDLPDITSGTRLSLQPHGQTVSRVLVIRRHGLRHTTSPASPNSKGTRDKYHPISSLDPSCAHRTGPPHETLRLSTHALMISPQARHSVHGISRA
jgi:hypothetical protein